MNTRSFLVAPCLLLAACATAPRPALDATRTVGNLSESASAAQREAASRAAFWCQADLYRSIAEATSDERIARRAEGAAARYERAAPTPQQRDMAGWRPGERIVVGLDGGATCTTTVR